MLSADDKTISPIVKLPQSLLLASGTNASLMLQLKDGKDMTGCLYFQCQCVETLSLQCNGSAVPTRSTRVTVSKVSNMVAFRFEKREKSVHFTGNSFKVDIKAVESGDSGIYTAKVIQNKKAIAKCAASITVQ